MRAVACLARLEHCAFRKEPNGFVHLPGFQSLQAATKTVFSPAELSRRLLLAGRFAGRGFGLLPLLLVVIRAAARPAQYFISLGDAGESRFNSGPELRRSLMKAIGVITARESMISV